MAANYLPYEPQQMLLLPESVDEHAHIIVAAELTNCASDAAELPTMLQAVNNTLHRLPEQVLADTGYKAEVVFEALAHSGCDVVVAVGREGKQPLRFDAQRSPHTAAMAAKLCSDEGKAAYRRAAIASIPFADHRARPSLGQHSCPIRPGSADLNPTPAQRHHTDRSPRLSPRLLVPVHTAELTRNAQNAQNG